MKVLEAKNASNDKWLSGLVDAMEEVSLMRSEDMCRSAVAPRALVSQLSQRRTPVSHPVRIAA
jgi:hypothetical protein